MVMQGYIDLHGWARNRTVKTFRALQTPKQSATRRKRSHQSRSHQSLQQLLSHIVAKSSSDVPFQFCKVRASPSRGGQRVTRLPERGLDHFLPQHEDKFLAHLAGFGDVERALGHAPGRSFGLFHAHVVVGHVERTLGAGV